MRSLYRTTVDPVANECVERGPAKTARADGDSSHIKG